jgi:hypothetical protein
VTLKAHGTAAAPKCEVIITGDLRHGQQKNLKVAFTSIGVMTTAAAGISVPIGIKVKGALALASRVAAVVAALTAAGTMLGYCASFRNALEKTREELDDMLLALQQHLDSQALFGDVPPPTLPRRLAGGDDAAIAEIITLVS